VTRPRSAVEARERDGEPHRRGHGDGEPVARLTRRAGALRERDARSSKPATAITPAPSSTGADGRVDRRRRLSVLGALEDLQHRGEREEHDRDRDRRELRTRPGATRKKSRRTSGRV
jgi:hypothetical protein